ncbi:MAG TPA: Fe-S cluster assembly protein SufD [Pyrinomonadaceae bacterium]|nr:Fe-S cluster assembly protein SufD [Pyrinomonadaceae bacterium]
MSQAIQETSSYRSAFEAFAEESREREPAWMARLREGAFERFEKLGFPTTDEEDWKYTNVAPLARLTFRPSSASEVAGAALSETSLYRETERSRLVFVNGTFRADLSALELPEGVFVGDLRDALAGEHETLLRRHLAGSADYEMDAFRALNTAFMDGGALVLIPKGVRVETPIHLLFLSAPAGEGSASFPRVVVVAERESEATVIESYEAAEGAPTYMTNAVVQVFVGDAARVTHYKVQDEGASAFHFASTRAELGRDGFYDLTTITLGAQLSRHGIEVELDNEGAECAVDGLYLVGTGQHADTHSLIDHRRAHCKSRQNYKGILDGKSRAVFNGRVFVRKDAQQTDAVQSNKNLLLSPEARVDTKPQLEIFADDVKCAHGATVGQLEEEELFYLLSRGLHTELARNLLTYGFAEEIVEKIGIDSIRARLDGAILNRLGARLEV